MHDRTLFDALEKCRPASGTAQAKVLEDPYRFRVFRYDLTDGRTFVDHPSPSLTVARLGPGMFLFFKKPLLKI